MARTPEEERAYNRERLRKWRRDNPEKVLEARERRRSKDNEACRRYYAENRVAQIARTREWRRQNPDKVRGYYAKRYRMLIQRTPKWASQKELREIYRKCPGGMHVDHIVPLWGLTADGYEIHGLNVPWNLAYLPPSENVQKGNRMRPEDHYALDVTNPLVSSREWRLRMSQ